MQPMYLVYRPPQMLPTTTLHAATSTASGTKSTGKVKRGLEGVAEAPLNWKLKYEKQLPGDMVQKINPDRLWWIGLSFTGIGGLLYFGPRRLGLRL